MANISARLLKLHGEEIRPGRIQTGLKMRGQTG